MDKLNILAVIPARGGSKGIPRKNIRPLAGKPLLAWTLAAAEQSRYISRTIVSTEDEEIASIAKAFGAEIPFLRPQELAQDTTPGIAPLLHVIATLPERYDYVVLLQPTSPLRTAADIDGCIEKCIQEEAEACITVTEASDSPHWMFSLEQGKFLSLVMPEPERFYGRQALPTYYVPNGAVYVARPKWLQEKNTFLTPETLGFVMPKERSVDIDTELEFRFCEWLLNFERG